MSPSIITIALVCNCLFRLGLLYYKQPEDKRSDYVFWHYTLFLASTAQQAFHKYFVELVHDFSYVTFQVELTTVTATPACLSGLQGRFHETIRKNSENAKGT